MTAQNRKLTHTLIGRACGPEPDDACAQIKVSYYSEPPAEDIAELEQNLRAGFRQWFAEDPVRVGVALLPYAEEHDGDGDDGS